MHREILWRVKIVTRNVTVKVLNSYQKINCILEE